MRNLHTRLSALEDKHQTIQAPTLRYLYYTLKTHRCDGGCGWEVNRFHGDHIIGKGYKNEKKYKITIERRYGRFEVDCWETPKRWDVERDREFYIQPDNINKLCEDIDEVEAFLNKTFPMK
jgi:hypothetical protein